MFSIAARGLPSFMKAVAIRGERKNKLVFRSNLMTIRGGSSSNLNHDLHIDDFEVVDEKEAHQGKYRQVIEKQVKGPDGKTLIYDILSANKSGGVTMFVWCTKSKTATLVKEYHPGPHKVQLGTVNGCFESDKHVSALQCATFELEEEVQMKVSTPKNVIPLLDHEDMTVPVDKYSDNRFNPYLILDAEQVKDPRPMDDEEFIVVQRGLSYAEIMRLIRRGEINVASSYTILLAFKKLEELRFPLF